MSDEDDFSNLPTIVIKVNISCCNACQKKLSKLLTKADGVASFEMNEEDSLVEIKGDADPQALVHNIAKSLKKKKTKLLHYEIPKAKSPPEEEPKKEDIPDDVASPPHYYYYHNPYHHRPPPPPPQHYGYGPPAPPPPRYSSGASHYFSDENASGCAIM